MRLCLGNVGLWVCDQACVWIVWMQEHEESRGRGRQSHGEGTGAGPEEQTVEVFRPLTSDPLSVAVPGSF